MYEFSIRQYFDTDYEFVYETKKLVYQKYIEENWGSWNETQQRKMFEDFIKEFGKYICIIMIKDNLIGFYHGEILDMDSYELGNICIIPQYQGQGIGTQILNSIIEENSSRDIYLRYFKQNQVGKLYKKLGFEVIEELPYHYKAVLKHK
jgi:ribosomal protein S18 acetylase RimI-like enzyme